MTSQRKWGSFAAGILYFALVASSATPTQIGGRAASEKIERARIAFAHALPKLDGRHLKATVVEVTYGPGESSMPHSHPCAVIGTMLEGALRTQVKGEPERTYKAGESFYEEANGVHQVSANASQQERARFLAYFVCDHDGPLSVDTPQSERAEGKQR
jgi:quercetin dioxygenase-like cupin family protein